MSFIIQDIQNMDRFQNLANAILEMTVLPFVCTIRQDDLDPQRGIVSIGIRGTGVQSIAELREVAEKAEMLEAALKKAIANPIEPKMPSGGWTMNIDGIPDQI